jgi:CHASE2 domain-containing sensor protein/tRNA A-37 threonylcarbamoyl transferase component Bud32
VALTLGAVALAAALERSTWTATLEHWTLDARTRALKDARTSPTLRKYVRPSPRAEQMVVVVFDDESMDELQERLPLPRRYWASFIDRAHAAGARLIAIDVFLHGDSRDPEDDRLLVESIGKSGRVVFARRWVRQGSQLNTVQNPQKFREKMLGQVSVLLFRDDDSMVRRYHLGNTDDARLLPSLALYSVIKMLGLKTHEYGFSEDGRELALGPHTFAIEQPNNGLMIDFAQEEKPFRVVSFSRLEETLKKEPELFRDKLVLLGLTYEASHDLHPVPVGAAGVRQLAGVYVHALAVRDLFTGNAVRRVDPAVDRILTALMLVAAGFLFARLSPFGGALALFALWLAWAAGAWGVYLARGVWIAVAVPAGASALLFAGFIGLKLREESKTRRSAETLLSSYFSPVAQAGLETADDPGLADRLLTASEVLAPEKYEITGKLGQGGMSVVFRAIQQPLGRPVALKFISPRLYRDRDAVQRFLREARLTGQLMHPNLVAVFDSGENHGVPYIALELVDGENLKSLIQRKGQLTPAEAVGLLIPALKGLQHAHDHGIVHRDIKSENILIGKDGAVKITDFGIAKVNSTQDAFETMQQVIVGTPAYLAPEQIRGEKLSPSSDLYSFGIVLYEMIAGRPPFLGESTGAILLKHLNDQPPDVADLGLEVPRGLLSVLRKLLEKQPSERYESATELVEALERLHLGEAPLAGVPGQAAATTGSGTVSMKSIKVGRSTTERIARGDTPL